MATKKTASKDAHGSGRRDVPVVGWRMGLTLNMGDYNSLVVTATIDNIDASSDKVTRREATQAAKSSAIVYEIVDNITGKVLDAALGEAGSGAIQTNFLKAIADTMEKNAKAGLYRKGA
jgi:hypothetical protein